MHVRNKEGQPHEGLSRWQTVLPVHPKKELKTGRRRELDRIEAAFAAIGRHLEIEIQDAA
jgi:hypothetical protein